MADHEQQDDYLSNMLNALNEKEQESQSYNDPETIARQAKENLRLRMLLKRLMSQSVKLMQTLS
ncbi:MAG: hypothetical protein ACLR7D_16975 [Lachnospira eligens]